MMDKAQADKAPHYLQCSVGPCILPGFVRMALWVSEMENNSWREQHCYGRCPHSWVVLSFRETCAQSNGKQLQMAWRTVKQCTELYGRRASDPTTVAETAKAQAWYGQNWWIYFCWETLVLTFQGDPWVHARDARETDLVLAEKGSVRSVLLQSCLQAIVLRFLLYRADGVERWCWGCHSQQMAQL